MATTSEQNLVRSLSGTEDGLRVCWVCFGTENEEVGRSWVKPCKCRGSTKWVHVSCMQRWIDERLKHSPKATCVQCKTDYVIAYPKQGFLFKIFEHFDKLINKGSPLLSGGFIVGSLWWTSATFGAVTVIQVMGVERGSSWLERSDPLYLSMALPSIPLGLIFAKLIRWEEFIFKHICKNLPKFDLYKTILPAYFEQSQSFADKKFDELNTERDPCDSITDRKRNLPRTICGALVLPTIASIIGRLFFSRLESSPQRAFMGGMAFMLTGGLFKIYLWQGQYLKELHRQILDYEDSPPYLPPPT